MDDNQNFCILPWIHLHIMPNGNAFPCCYSSTYATNIGNLATDDLKTLINSDDMKQIRLKMLNNEPVKICNGCMTIEGKGCESPRIQYNRENLSIIKSVIKNTNKDGSINDFKMRHLHFRHSNLCNYACRTCGPDYSSVHNNNKIISISQKIPNYLSHLDEHLPYVTSVSLTGGESLLLEENFYVLDKLISIGNTNVKINFVTNLSKLYYKNKSIIDYIKIFGENNVTFVVSIDALGKRAELLRYGCNWENVENNIKTLIRQNVKIHINCTLSAYNIWHGVDIEEYLLQHQYVDVDRINLFPLTNPTFFDIRVLPKDYKNEVTIKIQKYLDKRGVINKLNMKNDWSDIINYMNSEDRSFLLANFFKYTKKLDSDRNESTFNVFPELEKIKKYMEE